MNYWSNFLNFSSLDSVFLMARAVGYTDSRPENRPLILKTENVGNDRFNQSMSISSSKEKNDFEIMSNDPLSCSTIGDIAESLLTHTPGLDFISSEDLGIRFNDLMAQLKATENSQEYNLRLREAEEVLLTIVESQACPDKTIEKMKKKYEMAYSNLPLGPGVITQKEVDYFNHLCFIPRDVVCQNLTGESFAKPSISIEELTSNFRSLGYLHIMFSREVKEFDYIPSVCDVVMLGVQQTPYDTFAEFLSYSSFEEICVKRVEELCEYFHQSKVRELGYQYLEVHLIENCMEKEKAERLIAQGFQICVVFVYQKTLK